MDVTYFHVWAVRLLGWPGFHRIRGASCARYVSDVLDGSFSAASTTLRLFVTCAQQGDFKPYTAAALASDLSCWADGKAFVVLATESKTSVPVEGHLRRAKELAWGSDTISGVFSAEVVLVRDKAKLHAVIAGEARRAKEDGRSDDERRLNAQVSCPALRGKISTLNH